MKTLILAVLIGLLSLVTFHDAHSATLKRMSIADAVKNNIKVAGVETFYGEIFLSADKDQKTNELMKNDLIETHDGTILYPEEIEFVYGKKDTNPSFITRRPSIDF